MGKFFPTYLDLIGTVMVLSIVFFVFEQLLPAEKNQRFSKRIFNTIYYPFIVIGVLGVQLVFAPLFAVVLNLTGGGLLTQLITLPKTFWAQALFALTFAFVWDLWQYWVHRLQHRWPVLWETHKFHHSETDLNSSAQARHHLSNYFLFSLLYLPLLVIFGSLTPHVFATFVMFRLWGFVNHANTRIDLGRLTPIAGGPQWHRIHHSIYPEHYDKNFATFFPFIDMIFGTYYRPRKGEYPPTGLTGERAAGSLQGATVAPLIGWYRILANRVRGPFERAVYSLLGRKSRSPAS